MKQHDQRQTYRSMSLVDLKKEVKTLENTIDKHVLDIQFGKTKQVSSIHNFKKQLARALTFANQKLRDTQKD